MGTRTVTQTIPSSFQTLDDHVTTADEYIDVHTLQTARKNANIILARGSKNPIWQWTSRSGSAGAITESIRAPSRTNGDYLVSVPIYVPPYTQTCTFVGRFLRLNSLDVELYGAIDGPGEESPFDTSTKITVNSGTQARYSMTIPVPAVLYRRGGVGRLVVGLTSKMSGSDADTGRTIIDAFRDHVVVQTFSGGTNVGYALYFAGTGGDLIEPRVITYMKNKSGSPTTNYVWVDEPFNIIPTPGTTTASSRTIGRLSSFAMTLYADPVTDFGTANDVATPEA